MDFIRKSSNATNVVAANELLSFCQKLLRKVCTTSNAGTRGTTHLRVVLMYLEIQLAWPRHTVILWLSHVVIRVLTCVKNANCVNGRTIYATFGAACNNPEASGRAKL